MDVVVWLRSLGLGRYEAAFHENEIDETVLPSLTHETSKELGVTGTTKPLWARESILIRGLAVAGGESAASRSGAKTSYGLWRCR
jgi:SAM domain (Sterile alpha motif)